ncbi:MAG: DUF998 domain-containing protein, partial [Bacteroidota bacterium]
MRTKYLNYLPFSGVVGTILFTTTSIISGLLKPGYKPIHHFVSELGATNSSTEFLMNYLGFIPSGFLFCLFGLSIFIMAAKNLSSKIGSLLIMVFGLGIIMAGIFSCDAGCPPNGSMESTIHDLVSVITLISVIMGIILLGFTIKAICTFQSISIYLTSTGFISIILLVVMVQSSESRYLTGLWQRLLLA